MENPVSQLLYCTFNVTKCTQSKLSGDILSFESLFNTFPDTFPSFRFHCCSKCNLKHVIDTMTVNRTAFQIFFSTQFLCLIFYPLMC